MPRSSILLNNEKPPEPEPDSNPPSSCNHISAPQCEPFQFFSLPSLEHPARNSTCQHFSATEPIYELKLSLNDRANSLGIPTFLNRSAASNQLGAMESLKRQNGPEEKVEEVTIENSKGAPAKKSDTPISTSEIGVMKVAGKISKAENEELKERTFKKKKFEEKQGDLENGNKSEDSDKKPPVKENSPKNGLPPPSTEEDTITLAKQSRKSGRKKIFTEEEEKLILEKVKLWGEHKWKKIAKEIPTKNRKQIREHYMNFLKIQNDVMHGAFTKEEDAKLLTAVKELGRRWTKIAERMPGRSPIMLKNRYFSKLQYEDN